jgi:hypothetical protein
MQSAKCKVKSECGSTKDKPGVSSSSEASPKSSDEGGRSEGSADNEHETQPLALGRQPLDSIAADNGWLAAWVCSRRAGRSRSFGPPALPEETRGRHDEEYLARLRLTAPPGRLHLRWIGPISISQFRIFAFSCIKRFSEVLGD